MQKIYLAGPFFNARETALIHTFAARLREKYEVFVPMEHTAEGDVPDGAATARICLANGGGTSLRSVEDAISHIGFTVK